MRLSETFDTVAELYDRARPRYPQALYDDLAALSGLGPGASVLEIAPATGIVTVPLARRGYRVTAVEMGANLAAIARRNLAEYPNANVEVARFEEWPLPYGVFDMVCCATAFSWLEPSVRLEKCAFALKPGGYLAIWDTQHVAGGSGQFFIDVQECYERWMPGTEPGLRLRRLEDMPANTYGLKRHPAFEVVAIRDYPFEVSYTTEGYLDVLRTYSGHIALDAANATGLYACIEELIEGRYGPRIVKAYAAQLVLARRK